MRKVILSIAIISFILLSVSCGPKSLPFPLKEENAWIYEDKDGNMLTYKIVGSKMNKEKEQILYHYGTFREGTMGKIDYYFQTEEGLFYYDKLTSKKAIPSLKYPLKEGAEWSYGEGESKINFKVLAVEDVSVPAGDFNDCYKIEYKIASGDFSMVEWFCPQIGFIKFKITKQVEVKPEKEEEEKEEEAVTEVEEEEKEPEYKTVTTIYELTSYTLN